MGKEIITEYGTIDISRDVIAQLAGIATMECVGVVGVVNSRTVNNINDLLRRDSLSKGVDVSLKDNRLTITVNIVVGYGIPMNIIGSNITERVKYAIQKHLELAVDRVCVNVQGIKMID